DGIRDRNVTGVQTCALPISLSRSWTFPSCCCVRSRVRTPARAVPTRRPPTPECLGQGSVDVNTQGAGHRREVGARPLGLFLGSGEEVLGVLDRGGAEDPGV